MSPEPAAAMASPAAGALQGGAHVYPLRVYFEDTDVGGVVYHASYLRFAERARTEMLRCLGFAHSEMMAREGLVFTVSRCEIDYLRPARLDDALEVHTVPAAVGAASLWLDQSVRRGAEELARLRVRLACVGGSGRPARLPAGLRRALVAHRPGVVFVKKERV